MVAALEATAAAQEGTALSFTRRVRPERKRGVMASVKQAALHFWDATKRPTWSVSETELVRYKVRFNQIFPLKKEAKKSGTRQDSLRS